MHALLPASPRILQWRHNECHVISNHLCLNCLLKHLFWHRSRKKPKLSVTGLCDRWIPLTKGQSTWYFSLCARRINWIASWISNNILIIMIPFMYVTWTSHFLKSQVNGLIKSPRITGGLIDCYPRPVLAFGYCRCLRLSVCVSVRPSVRLCVR